MSLLDNLSKMLLGYKGVKPKFNSEVPTSTLHNQSSNSLRQFSVHLLVLVDRS